MFSSSNSPPLSLSPLLHFNILYLPPLHQKQQFWRSVPDFPLLLLFTSQLTLTLLFLTYSSRGTSKLSPNLWIFELNFSNLFTFFYGIWHWRSFLNTLDLGFLNILHFYFCHFLIKPASQSLISRSTSSMLYCKTVFIGMLPR